MKIGMMPALAGAALVLMTGVAGAATLDDVKAKGFLQCGVHTGLAGFAQPNDAGEWSGMDVDYCRAVATPILNHTKAV
jgi:general L-amino acid transport system substrate-binding protein